MVATAAAARCGVRDMERDGGIGKAAWRGRGRGSTSNAAVDAAWRGRAMRQRGEGGGGNTGDARWGGRGGGAGGTGTMQEGSRSSGKTKFVSRKLANYVALCSHWFKLCSTSSAT